MSEFIKQAKELLAQNIKIHRKKRGISQEKLAETANLSTQTISDIEGCRTWVSDTTLEKLAKALNIEIFQLFMPINNEPEASLYNQIMTLKTSMKEDIDNRLDVFLLNNIKS